MNPLRIESADDEFEFYYRWSLDNRKQGMTFTNDVIRHLTTLSAVLLGGTLTFLTDKINPWCQGIAALFFLASLGFGLFGVLPYGAVAPPNEPKLFRRVQENALVFKSRLLYGMAILIGLAFITGLVGLAIKFLR